MNARLLLPSLLLVLLLLLGVSSKDAEKIISELTTSPTPSPAQTLALKDQQSYLVKKVIDGDTIELETGQKVRYIGIDTPELKGSECFAKEARDKNRELVEGKRVMLQKDVSETDRYGRLLRYVYTTDKIFINNLLILEGYAHAASFPPDIAQQDLFRASQEDATKNKRGLWNGC